MARYVGRRALATAFTVLLISMVVFVALQGIPGDAAIIILGDYYGHEEAEALRERLGLDQPLYVQYGRWLGGLLRGDFGDSLRTGEPVRPELASRVPVTLELAALSLLLSLVIGVPLGIASATQRRTALDYASRTIALLGISIPNFWQGLMLILVFGLYLRWVPTSGYIGLNEGLGAHLAVIALPVITLGTSLAGTTMRITRAAMLEVLGQDYIRTGRAKGLPERTVVRRHALRNALIPLITVVGLQFGDLLGRTVVVEEIFSLPGLGRFVVGGVFNRDYPVVMAAVLVISVGYALSNLAVDVLYARVDPRIRYD